MALHAPAGRGPGRAAAQGRRAASTISAPLGAGCQVRPRQPDADWQGPGAVTRGARQPAARMTGERPRAARALRDAAAAEIGEGEPVEVTFSPAEPELTLGAARAVLAMLLRAREKADRAES